MTKQQKKNYEPSKNLKKALAELKGRKFRIDCEHHVTFNHNLANNITILNGKDLHIICSECGY
jgi:hypothetical protein